VSANSTENGEFITTKMRAFFFCLISGNIHI
jgi:hypothetical protein